LASKELTKKFIEKDGILNLMRTLANLDYLSTNATKEEKRKQLITLQIINTIISSDIGINSILEDKANINAIVLTLKSPDLHVKTITCTILAYLSFYNQLSGKLVLNAFNYYKHIHREKKRFMSLIEMLDKNRTNLEFSASCIMLINSILLSEKEITSRIKLQQDFINLGVKEIFIDIRETSIEYNDPVNLQISGFYKIESENTGIEDRFDTPEKILDLITKKIENTEISSSLENILLFMLVSLQNKTEE
jgi:hypothetical protein